MSKVRQLLKGDAAALVVIGLMGQVLLVASGPFVARILGPHGRGEAAVILASAMVCNQLAMGSLGAGVSRTIARRGGTARDVVFPFLRTWLLWSLLPALVATGIVAAILRNSADVLLYAGLAFGMTIIGGVLGLSRNMVLGEGNIRKCNYADIGFILAYVTVVVLLFVFARDSGVAVVLLAYVLAQLISIVLLVRSLGRGTGAPADPTVRTEVHRFAKDAYFSSIGTLDRLGLDSLLVGHFLGAALLGLYSVASSVAAAPALVLGALGYALLPRMAAREPVAAAAMMRRWLLGAVLLMIPIIALLWLVFEPLLRIFFGADFAPAAWAGRFMAVANAAFSLRLMLNSAAQAQGREKTASRVSLVSSVGLLSALVAGALLGGLEGAAIGIMAAALGNLLAMGLVISWTGRDVTAPQTAAADD